MQINTNTIVGDIVRSNFKTAQLFEKNNIDFCCGGGITVAEACKNANIDPNQFLPEIEQVLLVSDPDSKYIEGLELDELSDYIVKRHHSYVRENIPFLKQKLQKLCDVHGENHPELFEVNKLFSETAGNLTMHMQKEEMILFPYIRNMVKQKQGGPKTAQLGNVLGPIEVMNLEHQAEGERFEKIGALTNNFTTPADGCNTYQVTFKTLQDFEQDLHRHIHLESNILFKKAIDLEKELTT
jgi:regulator of cell morphogenesis and NO signaling